MSFRRFLSEKLGYPPSKVGQGESGKPKKSPELLCNTAPSLNTEIRLSPEARELLINFTQILEANYKATGQKISPELLQAKQQELKRMLFLWQHNIFIVDQTGFSIAEKLLGKLNAAFRVKDIEIPLFGSLTSGGKSMRGILAVPNLKPMPPSDLDCGLIASQRTLRLLEEIKNKIYGLLKELHSPYLLCLELRTITNINTIEEAQKMLKDYFLDSTIAPANNVGILYFFPTFPLEKWTKNMSFIRGAFKNFDEKTQQKIHTTVTTAINSNYRVKDKHLTYHGTELPTFADQGNYNKLIKKTELLLNYYIYENQKHLLHEYFFNDKPLPYVVL